MTNHKELRAVSRRAMFGAIAFALALLAGIQVARAGEIVPSVGLTRNVDGSTTKASANLAVRGNLGPLMPEIAVGYRSEDRAAVETRRMWPVTASLYLTPIPMLYAGGGVGWYHTTVDFADATGLADHTREDFGVHLGGGVQVPLGSAAGLDLGGRYVMMRNQDEDRLIPQHFNPDFWMTNIGLAIKFH
jgi:opacity protein-like surface antigen